eukprot:COSAG01_NODE_676_length_14324_cov_17.420105_7_plen_48_part_00
MHAQERRTAAVAVAPALLEGCGQHTAQASGGAVPAATVRGCAKRLSY